MGIDQPPTAVPLLKAIERYGDQVLRFNWEEARRRLNDAGGPTRVISTRHLDNDRAERDNRHRRSLMSEKERAEAAYIADFWSKLSNEELIAWGRAGSPGAARAQIEAAFRYLTPDFQADIIRGPNDLTYFDVRVAHRDEAVAQRGAHTKLSRRQIDEALKNRLSKWDPAIEAQPKKEQVYKELVRRLGHFSRREFDQRWAENAPTDWKKPGVRRRQTTAS